MDLIQLSTSLLILSQLVDARAVPDDLLQPWLRSRSPSSSLSKRARANAPRRGISVVAVVVIVILALAAIIGLVVFVYLCNRHRQKRKQAKQGHNMNYMATPSAPGAREGDWWQPPESTNNTLTSRPDSNNNRLSAPYGAGGQGYTYGQSVDHRASRLSPIPTHSPLPSQLDHRTSVIGDHRTTVMGDHRTSVIGDHRTSVLADPRTSAPAGGIGPQAQGSPFQIPVADYYRPRPAPSISPSYHTTAIGGEMSVEAGEAPHHPPPPAAGGGPPTGFPRRQQTLEPLQPQQTGTSIYSSPYEITAMTQSTQGHPGGH